MNFSVFILAAGLGERLRPITNYIPKPLIPILGKPILQFVLEKVSTLPINKIGMNIYHKKEVLKNWIKKSPFNNNVELFPEDPILGTGGALKNAEAFLKNHPFLVHNSDIISDIDLHRLIKHHLSSDNIATLAVHNFPEFNRLILDKNGLLKDIVKHPHPYHPPKPLKILAFTGIAVYQPEFLQFLPEGSSSVVDAWFKAISAGHKIGTIDVSGCYWSDIGTPSSYAKAVADELRKTGETVYIHPSVDWCKNIEINGYVVIEKQSNPPLPPFSKRGIVGFSDENILNKSISLRNCIVLPYGFNTASAHLLWQRKDRRDFSNELKRSSFENCILGPRFKIDFSESDIFESYNENIYLIGTGGSDRKYYRVRNNKHTVVLMQCHDDDPDFHRHIEYTKFFSKYSIPVPDLLDVNTNKKQAYFEDLGDLSLYSWLKCKRKKTDIERMYKKVLDILILIHTVATENVSECPLLQHRIFDYDYLRWETNYFVERFIKGIIDIEIKDFEGLNNEFHRLAINANSFAKTIVHRDFQSQNILVTKGDIPRVVDYQGARIGPPAYDVVSILWDPYYRLEDDMRERLLDYYIDRMKMSNPPYPPLLKGGKGGLPNNKGVPFDEIRFRISLLPCRLQRHMQALGAYGFLSKIKGIKYFLKYIPEGLRLLKEDVSLSKKDYPILFKLVIQL